MHLVSRPCWDRTEKCDLDNWYQQGYFSIFHSEKLYQVFLMVPFFSHYLFIYLGGVSSAQKPFENAWSDAGCRDSSSECGPEKPALA